jgi:hypothetical protein
VIRNAVIHLLSEQPMMADLFDTPGAGDTLLVCTNLRTLAGARPVFIDESASTFIFPYTHIRFIELRPERPDAGESGAGGAASTESGSDADLEIDEEFLKRIRDA